MKKIIVTGAAKGIGRAIVSGLLSEGYAVLAVDIDEAGLEEIRRDRCDELEIALCDVTHGADFPGAIVNLGSSSMYGGSDPVYSSTKAGLVGLTKACAKTFAPSVRVNLVAPGIVETGMFASLPSDVVDWYRSSELLKSPLVAKDVANTVAFLMSDNARNYTGAFFDLNNGFHL